MQVRPIEKYPALQSRYEDLEQQRKLLIKAIGEATLADNGNLYYTDFVMMGIVKRSLDLLDGIICLIDRWNYSAAGALLRLQIDSLLRLWFLKKSENSENLAKAIFEGNTFRKLKDVNGRRLTDERLRFHARDSFPWLDAVYQETSGLIHFSDKHIWISVVSLDEPIHRVNFHVKAGNDQWPEQEIEKLLVAVGLPTNGILQAVLGWANLKEQLNKSNTIQPSHKNSDTPKKES